MSFVITWAHRNRPVQADQLIEWTAASIGPEPRTYYALQVRNAADVLLTEHLNIGGATATVTSNAVGVIKFKLWSIRDGYPSKDVVAWSKDNVAPSGAATTISATTYVPPDVIPVETSNRITTDGDVRVTSDGSLRACK